MDSLKENNEMPSWFKKLFQTSTAGGLSLEVRYQKTLVGTLEFKDGFFEFKYNQNCPVNLRIMGLEFPITQTKHLPPFFSTRLPSPSRPEIEKIIKTIGSNDPITLLGELSSSSPVSPYTFVLHGAKKIDRID